MSQFKWNDDLKYSILQLKMNISAKDFKLAGPCIGLEKKKEATRSSVRRKNISSVEESSKAFSATHEFKSSPKFPRKN